MNTIESKYSKIFCPYLIEKLYKDLNEEKLEYKYNLELKYLRKLLKCENKLKQISSFKHKVLDIITKDFSIYINNIFTCKYKCIKTGKRITNIIFILQANTNSEDNFLFIKNNLVNLNKLFEEFKKEITNIKKKLDDLESKLDDLKFDLDWDISQPKIVITEVQQNSCSMMQNNTLNMINIQNTSQNQFQSDIYQNNKVIDNDTYNLPYNPNNNSHIQQVIRESETKKSLEKWQQSLFNKYDS